MDKLVSARLLDTRFEAISVERGPGAELGTGGKLEMAISASMAESKGAANQAISKIELNVVGIPTKAKNKKQFGFKVRIVCAGRYEWPTLKKHPALNKDAAEVLCLPIYATAAAEATRLVRSLEMGTLRLPGDIRTAGDEALALKQEKPLPKRAATKPKSAASASKKKV